MNSSDGWFDSKGEWRRWLFLKDAERDGKITNLSRQVPFPIYINDMLVTTYVADYVYNRGEHPISGTMDFGYGQKKDFGPEYSKWIRVVEDFKGVVTPEFKLKAKLILATYNIPIKIVKVPTAPLD